MDFFRSEEGYAQLTSDDRIELFSFALKGRYDITKELLDSVFSDYDVDNLEVVEV